MCCWLRASTSPLAAQASAGLARKCWPSFGVGGSSASCQENSPWGRNSRIAIARAFSLEPRYLLLDEPFGMLDSITRRELQELVLRLWEEDRKTVLMVTHDIDEALFLSDRILLMTDGPESRVGREIQVKAAASAPPRGSGE